MRKACFAPEIFVTLPLQLRCKRRLRAAAQRRPSELASAFTLHRSCNVNQKEAEVDEEGRPSRQRCRATRRAPQSLRASPSKASDMNDLG